MKFSPLFSLLRPSTLKSIWKLFIVIGIVLTYNQTKINSPKSYHYGQMKTNDDKIGSQIAKT